MRLNNKAANRFKARSGPPNKKDALWSVLKDKYDIGVEARKPYEQRWVVNLAFLAGQQYSFFNAKAHMLQHLERPQSRMWVTDNLLIARWRRQIADLIKTTPSMSVVPQTNDDDDIKAAKIGNKVIKSFWQTNQLKTKLRQMAGWMYATGNGFIDDRWNVKLGPVERSESGLIYLGDVDCGVWSPLEILVPFTAMGETDIHSFPWLIKAKRRTLEWISNNYDRGDEVKEESFTAPTMSAAILMGTVTEPMDSKIPSAVVMDFYLQPTKAHPKGLFLTGSNGIILNEDEYPLNFYHIEHFKDIDVPGVFWGQATTENAVGLQRTWNSTLSSITEFNRTMAKGKLMVPRGAKLDTSPDDSHGEIVEFTPVFGLTPQHLTLKGLPSTVDQVLALTQNSLQDLYNQHEVTRGTNRSDIRSGEMVSQLREQDSHGNIPSHAVFEESLERLAKRILERIRSEYITERMLKITGDEGEFEIFKFKGTDIRDNTDVIVKRESSLPDSRIDRETKILRKYELGLYGDPSDPKVRRSVMRMIEDTAADALYEPDRLDERMAERENNIMMQAQDMDDDTAKSLVNRYDNHTIHNEIHDKYRKGSDYQKLKLSAAPEEQRAFLEAEAKFNAHNGLHSEFIAEQQQALLQQQIALQGGGNG